MEFSSYPRTALPKGCCLQLHHQSESQLLPAYLGGSVLLACESDPSLFQMTTSAHFPQSSGSSKCQPHWPSKANYFGSTSSKVQDSLARQLKVGLRPLPFWERIITIVIILMFVCLPLGILDSIVSCPLFYCSSFFIFLLQRKQFASLQVMVISICSVNTCNFGIPMGGIELRGFLQHHVDHSLLYVCLQAKTILLRFLYFHKMFQFQEQETPEFVLLFQNCFGYLNSLGIQ